MSSTDPGAFAPDSPDAVRPLPPRPSLEYERKQAKRLLAHLKRGDPDSLERAKRHLKRAASTQPSAFKLADAQFTIAREYGFQSWPRLVEYFTVLERHERSPHSRPESFVLGEGSRRVPEAAGSALLARHGARDPMAANLFASFAPRYYGLPVDRVFATEPTVDEARLVAARMRGFPSWRAMVESSQQQRPPATSWERNSLPFSRALRTLRDRDDARLDDLVRENPGLLTEESPGRPGCSAFAYVALNGTLRMDPARAVDTMAWLGRRMDLQPTLNWLLLGHVNMPTETVRVLLDHGADPAWVPPNGVTVLEHAVMQYWNGEAVDLIAARVKPPRAFWIAAGLGDVASVARYVDRRCVPTTEARQRRPDFLAIGPGLPPSNPGADDLTIVWEAFLMAAFNQRFRVLDLLLDRGFPVDYDAWGMPLLHLAIGNGWEPLVEYLVTRGADVDRKGARNPVSARQFAESSFKGAHPGPSARRILELCGGRDPELLLREREVEQANRTLEPARAVVQAVEFAKHDAWRLGLDEVTPESLFVALVHEGKIATDILWSAGVDMERLKANLSARLEAPTAGAPEIRPSEDVGALLAFAAEEARRRLHDSVTTFAVLVALVERAPGALDRVLGPAGASAALVRSFLDRHHSTL